MTSNPDDDSSSGGDRGPVEEGSGGNGGGGVIPCWFLVRTDMQMEGRTDGRTGAKRSTVDIDATTINLYSKFVAASAAAATTTK